MRYMNETFIGKTVVLTGAAGFIGSHLADEIIAQGGKVIGIDSLITGRLANIHHLQNNPNFTFIEHDLVTQGVGIVGQLDQVDVVLHFASPASPDKYQAHPVLTYQVNSQVTHAILELLHRKFPQATFLFASTSEVYGDPLVHPQPETYWGNVNPNGARSCYDEAKRMGETICGVWHREYGMDTRIVRIFNTYGPRLDLDDGRVIPSFVKAALAHQPLIIFGDPGKTRSYCYVSDLVSGILALAVHENGAGVTLNLGNPGEYSLSETAQAVYQAVTGEHDPVPFEQFPDRQDDPTRRKPDISRAQLMLNWQPVVSFEDGIKRTVESVRSS